MRKIESGHFSQWLKKLKDDTARACIVSRVNRLMEGLPGDVSGVGGGVSELRIHVGPGYRVYFHRRATTWIVLLCAGDKSSQQRDITLAKRLLDTWKAQND